MFPGNVTIEGDTCFGYGVIAANGYLAFERPGFSIERSTEDLKQVHFRMAFSGAVPRLLVGRGAYVKERLTKPAEGTITHRVTMNDRIDELLELIEVEPDALREAEFLQAQAILETLIGKTIQKAEIQDTRIVITTGDGNRYFFYGFLGEASAHA